MEAQARHVEYYRRPDGACPSEAWMRSLQYDIRAIIQKRLDRIERGVLGDYKPVGEGVMEFRIHDGPGYRLYAGFFGNAVIVLTGSDKSQQERTIPIAKALWREFKQRMT